MPIDASIYGLMGRGVTPINEYALQNANLQMARQNQQINALKLQQDQQAFNDQNALRAYFQTNPDLNTAEGQAGAYSAAPLLAPKILQSVAQVANTKADTAMKGAHAGLFNAEASQKAFQTHRDMLGGVNSPEDAVRWVLSNYSDPNLGPLLSQSGSIQDAVARIPTDPQAFQQWKMQNGMAMDKYIEATKPVVGHVNTGGATVFTATAPLTGQVTQTGSIANTVSPDTVANNATSRANNAATNATSRANTSANIAKDFAVAGINPDGTPGANVEEMAQAIANGQLPPISGFALARPQGQTVMRRVMEINPNYDATQFGAKQKAARDFTSGPQGNAMRSFAVAGQHLDQLNQLVDALGNGNIQLVNKIGNTYAEQTGNPAPTNFDAAKDVVSKEVIKAIVAGGGGVSEREELARLMGNAKSPAQLKGVIQQYRSLMGAQHDALLQQRRAAGLPDSTLPSYSDANGSPSTPNVPPDIAAILQKHGGK